MNFTQYLFLRIWIPCSLLASLFGVQLHAQEPASVFGTVIDSLTHEPIAYASVYFANTYRGTTSDLNGYFSLSRLPGRRLELVVEYIGYTPYRKMVSLDSDSALYLQVELRSRPVQSDSAVVVESRRYSQGLTDLGQLRLTSADLRKAPLIGEPDLFRTLSLFPGITTTHDFNTGLYVQGGNRDQNLILLDGMPIFNPHHLTGIFSTFDTEAIQLATLQKTRLDPAYGNRLSSILDINMRDGSAAEHTGTVNVSLLSSKILAEGPHPWGTYMLSLRRTYADLLVDGLRVAHIFPNEAVLPYHFTDFMGKIVVKPSPRQRLEFTSYLGSDQYDLAVINGEPEKDEVYLWSNTAGGLAYSHLVSPRLSIHAETSWSQFFTELPPSDSLTNERIQNQFTALSARMFATLHARPFGIFRLGGESQFLRTRMYTKGFSYQPLNFPSTSSEEHSGFFDWTQDFSDHLTGHLGGRATYFSQTNTVALSPQISLGYRHTPLFDLALQWGIYHQGLLTIGTEEVLLSMFDAWVSVPDYLQVMSARHSALTAEWKFLPGIQLTTALFLKQFPHLVEYNTEKYMATDPDFVHGTGRAYGLEFQMQKSTGRFVYSLNYTYSHMRKSLGGVTYPPKYDKPHLLDAWVRYRRQGGLSVGARFKYASGAPFTRIIGYHRQHFVQDIHGGVGEIPVYSDRNAYRLPPYHRLDLNFSKSFTWREHPMEWYLSLINVYARLNVLAYSERNDRWIQLPPLITIGIRGKIW